MINRAIYKYGIFLLVIFTGIHSYAQFKPSPTDSWKTVSEKKTGSISVLWYDIEPFIYLNDKGGLTGVEYDLMEGFKGFLRQRYDIDLRINWTDAKSFESIFPFIENSKEQGLFGMSFYSITAERKKKVKFSPPYMPDLNVIVTGNNLPVYKDDKALIADLPGLKGYTMKHTTMEEDIENLKAAYYPGLTIFNNYGDYEVISQISAHDNSFGYVPVSIYVMALQRGVKVKRQRVLAKRREGFAAIFTKNSDWDEPINEYFNSAECKVLVGGLIRRYLGPEVADIILNVSLSDTLRGTPTDIELLTKEREIVTKRLIDTALDAEKSKTQRNIFLLIGAAVLIIAGISYSRFRTKNKLSKLLKTQNSLIAEQKEKLDRLNKQLNIKILQSKLNPHFLFNSLNSVQYHVGADDKKGALQYIARFSGFLRKVLQSGDELLISVKDEAALAEQYLWLELNRFPDRFKYSVNVSEGTAEAETPPMLIHSILQESLYSNIINADKQDYYFLKVDFIKKDSDLFIQVRDNGPAKDEGKSDKKNNGLPEGNRDIFAQRLSVINSSALQPILLNYSRTENENLVILKIAQPLFHT